MRLCLLKRELYLAVQKEAESSEKVDYRYAIGTCVSYLERGKLVKW